MVWKEIHGNKQNGDYKILIRFGAQDDDLKNSFEKKEQNPPKKRPWQCRKKLKKELQQDI